MERIKIYLYGENNAHGEIIEIDDASSVKEIIIKHKEKHDSSGEASNDEYEIFLENDEEGMDKSGACAAAGIKHHHKVHCHRCKTISIDVEYNGRTENMNLAPSSTGARILRKAAELFKNITEGDATYLRLVLPDNTDLEKEQHIGSFVSYPSCSIKLILQSHKKIEG